MFLGLNQDNWLSLLRSAAKVVGGMLISRGLITDANLTGFLSDIPTWVGVGLTLVGLYTSHQAHVDTPPTV